MALYVATGSLIAPVVHTAMDIGGGLAAHLALRDDA